MNPTFHMSLPCLNIGETIKFYTDELGFHAGRVTEKWVDINLFNNQLTFVLVDQFNLGFPDYQFEQHTLPTFHFGVIVNSDMWEEMYDRVNYWLSDYSVKKTFLKDKHGEHVSFFIKDPNGYTLEFKTFIEEDDMFMM
ncbi:extradiol dioxygenase family protein [Tenacibaculum gallaicum]|uniref:Extradiol dioxygenase family protein n=1 Tax=Tenacibaculum gallaicum TaxID=561505 RepID=A0A3E0I7D1_9FLAO|nr:VOC family protein [Tenacibaculum gallaicum]REH54668.1 extradiol dioxygenase family protein [Tenacibaculum gallaicum]